MTLGTLANCVWLCLFKLALTNVTCPSGAHGRQASVMSAIVPSISQLLCTPGALQRVGKFRKLE